MAWALSAVVACGCPLGPPTSQPPSTPSTPRRRDAALAAGSPLWEAVSDDEYESELEDVEEGDEDDDADDGEGAEGEGDGLGDDDDDGASLGDFDSLFEIAVRLGVLSEAQARATSLVPVSAYSLRGIGGPSAARPVDLSRAAPGSVRSARERARLRVALCARRAP
eukprot:6207129-Pleurochrysis_carterae.AAC.1